MKPTRHTQRGQAAVEYGVVLAMVVLVLVVATTEPAVIDQLIASIRRVFRAFSWAISVAPQQGI